MNEDIIENIRKYVEESGIPLEIDTSSKLKEYGWEIRNQSYYFDEDLMKPRTVDIHAAKLELLKNNTLIDRFLTTLIIECKTSDKPWLFYTEKYEDEEDHLVGYISWLKTIKMPSYIHLFKKHELYIGNFSHYFWHKNERISVIGDVMHKGKDMLYEAACQVTKALNYDRNKLLELAPKMSLKPYAIFYPIIVFSGKMFEIRKERAELDIEEIKYISYNFSGVVKEKESFLIEIVHEDYFDEYLSVLNREYSSTLKQLETKL